MTGMTKRFGRHTVLDDVSFELRPGEVHVLAGENGAGKSTLIKILAGVHQDFHGEIRIRDEQVRPRSPHHANMLGIAVIHQELSLIRAMSVADNIRLGRTIARAGFVNDKAQRSEAVHWLAELGLKIDPRRPVEQFSIATQQCIEIAKALSQNAKVIVMDEPTSALSEPEVERLFVLIERLKASGCGIIYITHKMEEIARIADRITVLRDGKLVGTRAATELSPPKLVQWMVGRDLHEQIPPHTSTCGDTRLELRDFSIYPRGRAAPVAVRSATFAVRAGEIVGFGGLQGSGASELFLGIFGAFGKHTTGALFIDGRKTRVTSPRQAIDSGMALLTNDRKETGLVLSLPVVTNLTLANLPQVAVHGWRRPAAEHRAAVTVGDMLRLRAASLSLPVSALSGGNQQKVAIGKWLVTQPRVLLLDEPTRGIDIGAKHEIYELLRRLADEGVAILMISSEMPELLALSDRIVVMHRGRIMVEMLQSEATPEKVLSAAMGQSANSVEDAA